MLASALDVLFTMLSLLALVPALVLFVELMVTRHPVAVHVDPASMAPRGVLAVLMPAHDEANGIAPAIRAVLAQLRPDDRLLVVADNCTDATAAVSRAAGAEVIERHDGTLRGKGHALDAGVRWLARAAPPAVVVIVDADCIVEAQSLEILASRCLASGRPVQALYLMHEPPGAALGQRIAAFAWLVKNKLRPLGAAAVGWPCQLMGTGMAFPWALIEAAPLASSHLVEDMQLGLDLAAAGRPPLFAVDAVVTSHFPSDAVGVTSQRTRWEHGHLAVIARTGPRLLAAALQRGDPALLGMTLDLMVPPLAALVLGLVMLLAVDLAWWALAGSARPALLCTTALLLIAVSVMTAWSRAGRQIVTLGELASIPVYIAAKIPVYVRLLTKRQVEWVRTKRDDGHR